MDAGTGHVEGTSKLYGEHSVCDVRWSLFVLPAHNFQITQPFMTGLSAQHSRVVCCAVITCLERSVSLMLMCVQS